MPVVSLIACALKACRKQQCSVVRSMTMESTNKLKLMQAMHAPACRYTPPAFRQFTEAVVNLKFDEEPKYAAYVTLFEPLCGPGPAAPHPAGGQGARRAEARPRRARGGHGDRESSPCSKAKRAKILNLPMKPESPCPALACPAAAPTLLQAGGDAAWAFCCKLYCPELSFPCTVHPSCAESLPVAPAHVPLMTLVVGQACMLTL